MELSVNIKKEQIEIALPENKGKILILDKQESDFDLTEDTVFLLFNKHTLQLIGNDKALIASCEFDQVILIKTAYWQVDPRYIVQAFIDEVTDNGIKLAALPERVNVPPNFHSTLASCKEEIGLILKTFGYQLKKVKAKPAKAQHRWSKAVSEIDFFVDHEGSKAVCRWQSRNEMLIKKGATLKREVPLNKDGSVGFAAKFTLQLRDMNKDKVHDFITTDDIILKSVNEVGNFLYFAGINSWLVLKDQDGKTIDEWTVVK